MEPWRDELYHHGILGMKWGVRRYQNKDGTRTDAGKKRYKQDKKTRRQLERDAYETSQYTKAYAKTYSANTKKLNRQIDSDMKKYGELSSKTKTEQRTNELLRKDKEAYERHNAETVARLENHVNRMIKQYGDEKVSAVKSKEIDGQKHVETMFARYKDGGTVYVVKKSGKTVDSNGDLVYTHGLYKVEHYYY